MKKVIGVIIGFAFAVSALAQTAEEILSKMEEVFEQHENEGVAMDVDTKVPLIGTITLKTYTLGNKSRIEFKMLGNKLIIWDDCVTEYAYDSKHNEVSIAEGSGTNAEDTGDVEMFNGITDGYDVSIKKQTATAWYIQCKKSKNNPEEYAPKTMEVVVAKDTYYPISLSAKISGSTLTMRDLVFGVTDEDVTFDISKYPGAKVTDKRKK